MRILWLCNTVISGIRKKIGMEEGNIGGWLEETFENLISNTNNEYGFCAPFNGRDEITYIDYRGASFYGFKQKTKKSYAYDAQLEIIFKKILLKFKPDIIHIFGTEFPHTLAMVKTYNNPGRTVIHIQGLVFYWGGVIVPFYQQPCIMG